MKHSWVQKVGDLHVPWHKRESPARGPNHACAVRLRYKQCVIFRPDVIYTDKSYVNGVVGRIPLLCMLAIGKTGWCVMNQHTRFRILLDILKMFLVISWILYGNIYIISFAMSKSKWWCSWNPLSNLKLQMNIVSGLGTKRKNFLHENASGEYYVVTTALVKLS